MDSGGNVIRERLNKRNIVDVVPVPISTASI